MAVSLLQEIQDDTTISDVTKNELLFLTRRNITGLENITNQRQKELLTNFGDGIHFRSGVRRLLNEAREGISPIFKARQNTQALFETLFEQPGRTQTIAGKSNRNNKLLG